MIYHGIQVSSRETDPNSSAVAGVERCSKLATDQRCGEPRARSKTTDTQTLRHTFVSSFPSRLCAKLAPMVEWRRKG